MSPLDHILVALLIIGVPLWQHFYGIERMKREIEEDRPGIRQKMYRQTILIQWVVTALVMGFWFFRSRSETDLGLSMPGGLGFWIGLGVTIIAIAVLTLVQRRQMNSSARRQAVLRHLQDSAPFLPRNAAELRHFSLLALTAGICEEIVYRGYLIWYAAQFTGEGGLGMTLAVVLPALFFGLGHLYQGPRGMIQVFFAGLFFGGIYILTGSLWVSMLAHAIVDINGGVISLLLHRSASTDESDDPSSKPDSASPINERSRTPHEAGVEPSP